MPDRRGVPATYERIGSHFAKTRPEPWEEVTAFLDGRSGAVGLDLGAGNGRHTDILARHVDRSVAVDVSRTMLSTARRRATDRGFEFEPVRGDAVSIPIRSATVDLALYIATVHHLPTRSARIGSLDALSAVFSATGVGLVSVWSVSHNRFDRTSGFDTEIDWTLPDGETVPRFYHVYDRGGFEAELEASEIGVGRVFESAGNLYAVVGAKW